MNFSAARIVCTSGDLLFPLISTAQNIEKETNRRNRYTTTIITAERRFPPLPVDRYAIRLITAFPTVSECPQQKVSRGPETFL